MGAIKQHPPVLLLLAAFSRYEAGLDWAREQASQSFGPIMICSDVFPFDNTGYYERVMGSGLKKVLVAFENLIDPAQLADIKHQTNAWETLYRRILQWHQAGIPTPNALHSRVRLSPAAR